MTTRAQVVRRMLHFTEDVAKIRPKAKSLQWRIVALEAALNILEKNDDDLEALIDLRDRTQIGQVRTTLDEAIARCRKVVVSAR